MVAAFALLQSTSGWAQQSQDDASPINPAEAACLGQTVGSVCQSSMTTMAAGTCQAGCCCHYLTDPEGSQACEPCLACSDTAYLDPAFSPNACSDGGGTAVPDASVVPLDDAGPMPVIPPGPPTTTEATGGCACSAAGWGGRGLRAAAMGLIGALIVAAMFARKRT